MVYLSGRFQQPSYEDVRQRQEGGRGAAATPGLAATGTAKQERPLRGHTEELHDIANYDSTSEKGLCSCLEVECETESKV